IQLNYYDVNKPLEHSRVSLRTYINDATNRDLRPARNHKWEIRFGAEYEGNRLSVTYFNEKLNSGYRYSAVYAPYDYKKYDATAIVPDELTAAPDLATLAYTTDRVLDGYRRVTNGSRLDKEGIEFQINTMRWNTLCTALTVTGAWFRSTYTNSQMLFQTVNDVVDGDAVSDRYVGLYNANDGRVNEQFNTNFMFDTQITRWGLIFSTSVQCMWWVKTTHLWQNGIPDYYMSSSDGQLHRYDAATAANDKMLRYLIKTYNDDVYLTQTIPTAVYLNLKATKTLGKHLRIALFVNRMIDYLPDYQSNGLTVRRVSSPYFGMEMNANF
ncbi:MAG: outer membrane receptor protein, partial [Muribaculaceae bacterium]|nr:outer membrane receptor protein [Muribaculaceae bacterium]